MRFTVNESRLNAIIGDAVRRVLTEDVANFSFDELDNLPQFKQKYQYCCQTLGKPIGKGSSRVVFNFGDGEVLKLAYNQKGVAQNEQEVYLGQPNGYFDIFPTVRTHDDDDIWIVAQCARRATSADFQRLLGINFKKFCSFVRTAFALGGNRNARYMTAEMSDDEFSELCESDETLQSIAEYIQGNQVPIGDLVRPSSWGVVKKSYGEDIVLVDAGLTDDVYDDYYGRRR